MKVFVQIIDSISGIFQNGMIDEPVQKGFEINNALRHFGVNEIDCEWYFEHSNSFTSKVGIVKETSKIVTITIIQNK